MTLPYSLQESSKRTAGFGQAVVMILADCGSTGDDATQVSEVFQGIKVDAISADVRRTVYLPWRRLVQHLSLLKADNEAKILGSIRDTVDDVL